MKPLRIGPLKIINKLSDITYEIVNQEGYTSHIQRNHLVPYHPKEPIIFPFIQQYNLHANEYDDDNNISSVNDSINYFNPFSEEEQLTTKITHSQIPIKKRIYHPQSTINKKHLINIPHFRTNKTNKKLIIPTPNSNLIFMTMIIILILEDTPMTDTISAHNHEKTIDFSLVKEIYFHFLRILLEESLRINSYRH